MRFVQHFSGLRENIQASTQSADADCTVFLPVTAIQRKNIGRRSVLGAETLSP
jgi:hypothetical protein